MDAELRERAEELATQMAGQIRTQQDLSAMMRMMMKDADDDEIGDGAGARCRTGRAFGAAEAGHSGRHGEPGHGDTGS